MTKVLFTKSWKYAHDGMFVEIFEPGVAEVSEECAKAAIAEKVAEEFEEKGEKNTKAPLEPVAPAVKAATPETTGEKKPASASPRGQASGKSRSITARVKQKLS